MNTSFTKKKNEKIFSSTTQGCDSLRATELIMVSHKRNTVPRTWGIISCLPRCFNKKLNWKKRSQNLKLYSHRACQFSKQKPKLFCHNPSTTILLIFFKALKLYALERNKSSVNTRTGFFCSNVHFLPISFYILS